MSAHPPSPVRFVWPVPVVAGLSVGLIVGASLGRAAAGVVVGVGVFLALAVFRAVTQRAQPQRRAAIDPFTVNDPWRRLVQQAQSSQNRFEQQLDATPTGPVRDYLERVGRDLTQAVEDIWYIAQSGNQLDKTVLELEPSRLRSKMARLKAEDARNNDPNLDQAIDSMQSQLDTVEQLKHESEQTQSRLRLEVTRLGEVVSSAALVTKGTVSQQSYDADVRSLVNSLNALQSATKELPPS